MAGLAARVLQCKPPQNQGTVHESSPEPKQRTIPSSPLSPVEKLQQAHATFPELTPEHPHSPGRLRRKDDSPTARITCSVCLQAHSPDAYNVYNLRRRHGAQRRCLACCKAAWTDREQSDRTRFAMAAVSHSQPWMAVRDGNLGALAAFVRDGTLTRQSRNPNTGRTLLMEAGFSGQPDIVEWLLEHGADVHLRGRFGAETPLHMAVLGDCVDCADAMLIAGAGLNATNKAGQTPMHLLRSLEMAQFLIQQGARDDLPDKFGRTPHAVAAADPEQWKIERFLSRQLLERSKREQARAKALRQRRAAAQRQAAQDSRAALKAKKAAFALQRQRRLKEEYMNWRRGGAELSRSTLQARSASSKVLAGAGSSVLTHTMI